MSTLPKHPLSTTDAYALRGKAWKRDGSTDSEHPCPECGGRMTLRNSMGTVKGQPRVKIVYPHCAASADKDHGYGPHSKHVDPSYKDSTPTPTPTPQETPPVPSIFDAKDAVTPPAPTPAPKADDSNPLDGLSAWIKAQAQGAVNEDKVREIIAEVLKGQKPREVLIKAPSGDFKVEKGAHPVVARMVEYWTLGERTFMLVGPAGSSKSTITKSFAKAINALSRSIITFSEDMRVERLKGFYNPIASRYVESPLTRDLDLAKANPDKPVVTVFEEVDAGNSNVTLSINPLDNGCLDTPDDPERPIRERPDNHVLVLTANTWGTAASNTYVGRNQMDAATLDRYRKLWVDYDRDIEISMCGGNESVVDAVRAVREKAEKAGLRKVVGSRFARRLSVDVNASWNKNKALPSLMRDALKESGWTLAEIERVA